MESPKLSVVIASGAGGNFLFRCLESLREQVADTEVIVADRCGGDTATRLERDFPFVTVVRAEARRRPSVPELRRMGVRHARGDVVAVLEEHKVAPPGWVDAVRSEFRDGDTAIGGPISDDGFHRVRDWAVYFAEYHSYLPPWPDGERRDLAGANVAYRREDVLAHEDVLGSGYWEMVLHPRLAAAGGRFRSVPGMSVRQTGPFDYGYYLNLRYLLSRSWGGTQRASAGWGKRLLYLAAAPLFPALLLARISGNVLRSGQRVGEFFLALPLLLPIAVVYVWGEWLGYLLGPGDSLERVE